MLFLVDISNFVYKTYFSLNRSVEFENKEDLKQAVIKTMKEMNKTLKGFEEKGNVALIFDSPDSKNKRLAIYPEYKGTRKEKPEPIKYCLKLAEERLPFKKIKRSGLEADDIIARIVEKNTDKEILIVSTDGDMETLIGPKVKIMKNKSFILDEETLRDELGTDKDLKTFIQVRKALVGDSADNIKGVSGIGKVKSLKLLNSIEGDDLYNGILEKLNDKQKEEFKLAYELIKFQ